MYDPVVCLEVEGISDSGVVSTCLLNGPFGFQVHNAELISLEA